MRGCSKWNRWAPVCLRNSESHALSTRCDWSRRAGHSRAPGRWNAGPAATGRRPDRSATLRVAARPKAQSGRGSAGNRVSQCVDVLNGIDGRPCVCGTRSRTLCPRAATGPAGRDTVALRAGGMPVLLLRVADPIGARLCESQHDRRLKAVGDLQAIVSQCAGLQQG